MTPEQAEELLPTLDAILVELQSFRFEASQSTAVIAFIASALVGATVAAVVVLCFGRWFRR